ncbi:MAG TPA: hypothetical protein VKU00_27685 [Chthonomonadaceae bacterium]|nr:hypothetical protein [Chthonomonadaceae bacterium]
MKSIITRLITVATLVATLCVPGVRPAHADLTAGAGVKPPIPSACYIVYYGTNYVQYSNGLIVYPNGTEVLGNTIWY